MQGYKTIQKQGHMFCTILELKFWDQVKRLNKPGYKFYAPEARTLITSSRVEKLNYKKLFAVEITPQLPKYIQIKDNLYRRLRIDKGCTPFSQKILQWRLCLQASTPAWYYSYERVMERWSPLIIYWYSWDVIKLHKFLLMLVQRFCGFSVVLVKCWFKSKLHLVHDTPRVFGNTPFVRERRKIIRKWHS